MKIFVTGATGFLGYHFVNEAVQQGHEVLCLKRQSSVSLFSSIVEAKVQWVIDDDHLASVVGKFKPEVLFHAAWGGVRGSGRDDKNGQTNNVQMSRRFYELYPYHQIIAIGSQAEYGFYSGPVSENHPLNPTMEYALAKIDASRELQSVAEKNKIEWQWIRIFTVFGEKQKGSLISFASTKFQSDDESFETTEGKQIYNYMYSLDFAKAICMILGVTGKSGIYNLAQSSVDDYANRDILEKIKEKTKSVVEIKYGVIPYPDNQVMRMTANINKFETTFGVVPRTDFDVALESTIKSLK